MARSIYSNYSINTTPWAVSDSSSIITPDTTSIENGFIPNTTALAEYVNWLEYNQDIRFNSLIRQSGYVWSSNTQYVQYNLVTYLNKLYVALASNIGQQPNLYPSLWKSISIDENLYLTKASNLNDVAHKITAFDNIKQNSSLTYLGVTQAASLAIAEQSTEVKYHITAPVLREYVREYSIPIGTVIVWAANNTSAELLSSYIICQGAAISRTTYAKLFSIIGTTYGTGNGSTTFNVPDYRGYFLRGSGGSSASIGIAQGDAIRNISGGLTHLPHDSSSSIVASGAFSATSNAINGRAVEDGASQNITFNANNVVPTSTENRPVNKSVNYYIKVI